MNKWDIRFMGLAQMAATWSKDPDKQVGAAIVSPDKRQFSLGCNGLPRDIDFTDLELSREEKLELTIHAELNAIFNSAVDISDWTLYVTKHPCLGCATAIVQNRISRVVCPPSEPSSSWYLVQVKAEHLLTASNIELLTEGAFNNGDCTRGTG